MVRSEASCGTDEMPPENWMARSPAGGRRQKCRNRFAAIEGVRGIRVGQDDRELVAADAEGPVAVAKHVADAAGHAHEEPIARRMAFPVVDDLEVVEVDEQECQRHLVAPEELQLAVELLLEGAVVAKAGEAIVQGVLACLAVEHLELRLGTSQVVEGPQERPGDEDRDEQDSDGEADE